MNEKTNDYDPSPVEPGTQEPTTPQSNTAEAAAPNDEADAVGQVAPASPDSPEIPATRKFAGVWRTTEWLRVQDGRLVSGQVGFAIDSAVASDFQEMAARAQYTRNPWERTPAATGPEDYGITLELFVKIRRAIAEQTNLSDKDSALLTVWAVSSWFQDFLSVAPCLIITGFPHEGARVLSTLRSICYDPILLSGLTRATLNNVRWELKPTLLISEPCLSKQMAALLSSSTCRGYLSLRKLDGCGTYAFDYFGSKAIYLGEDPPMKSMLKHCIHINASPTPVVESPNVLPLSEGMTQRFQNRLLGYRIACASRVFKSDFNASGLSPEINAIASALGSCIVDAPDLRH